jgi:hypothetical protein
MNSCKTEPPGPWEAFVKCATNACVAEVVAVKDAFLHDPKAMLEKFDQAGQKGEDHFIGWLYVLRDSVLLNSAYAGTEERFAMQQAIIEAAKAHEADPKYGELAKSIVGEIEVLAIASELEDLPADDFAPLTGTYAFELPNKGGTGELKVNRTDGENIRFDLLVVGGPPANNQGTMQGTAKLTSVNTYDASTTEFGGTCRLQFTFDQEAVEIKTLEGDPATCGFGNGVMADNVYRMTSYDDPFLSGADAKTAKNLQGAWVSTEDPKSELLIENGMYVEIYDGQEISRTPYHYFPTCPAACNPVDKLPCLAVMGQDDICYSVIDASGKNLSISMIGGRGNTLAFKRK